ncbi:MAG: sodium:solute symporter family protein [Spirochaetaceae bacterium]|jgi:SSS family solute:Na+ symporter|nr:sodium:solute symporter family protein [Spirochaetaceae bacterium]
MLQNFSAIAILGLFMFIPLCMGLVANKKLLPTTEDFFVQGRAMGSVAVFFTVAATWWSAFAFLGSNGYFYAQGPVYWTAIAWNLLFGFLYYFIGKRIWFYGHKNNCITASDFFRKLYGSPALANLVAIVMLVFTIPYLQVQLTGGAYLIEVASGGLIPWKIGGLLFYAVIVVYVWAGGLRAVAWTDIFYGILLFFGMVFAGFYLAAKVGGTTALFRTLKQTAPESLTLPGPKGTFGPMMWVSMFIVTPLGSFMGPQLWTRMYAVKSSRLFNLMPFLLGFAAIAYIGSMLAGNTGIVLEPGVAVADQILPVMLFKYAPFALAALICAGGAAAAMSTANSQIHSMSAVYTVDIYQRYINTKADHKKLILIGRVSILVFALIAYFMSVFIPGFLVTIGLVAMSGTAQIFVPTVGILFWKRSTASGALAGLIAGVLLICLFTFVPAVKVPWGMHSGLFSIIVNTILFVVVSLLTPLRSGEVMKSHDEQEAEYEENYA